MVSRNFVVVAEILFDKYRDISASSTLNPGTNLNIFCGVAHNMCNTKVKGPKWAFAPFAKIFQ